MTRPHFIRFSRCMVLLAASSGAVLAGCGGGSSAESPQPAPMSAVTVMAASTGNDRVSQFVLSVNFLSLTNQSGTTIDVITSPLSAEFVHLNGNLAPLASVNIPQGVYVSATLTVGGGYTCIALEPNGGLLESEFGGSSFNATVQFPQPVTISAPQSHLVLSLLSAQSALFSSCNGLYSAQGSPAPSTALMPTFTISADTQAQQAFSLSGLVSSLDAAAGQFSVTTDFGITWPVRAAGATVYQGIAGLPSLAAGMAVDMDVTIAPDGSLSAVRVAVPDTSTVNLSAFRGPAVFVDTNASVIGLGPPVAWGQWVALAGSTSGPPYLDVSTTLYQISGRLTNLSSLPFTPAFNANTLVPGQNVYVTNHALVLSAPGYSPASTVTLMPQTIDGTVVGIAQSGGFAVYTVALAPYDLFPTLAAQPAQTSQLQNPSTVFVYADSGTQMLNTAPVANGGVLRFNGLVFNDNGTLRMDCAQVLDGVAP